MQSQRSNMTRIGIRKEQQQLVASENFPFVRQFGFGNHKGSAGERFYLFKRSKFEKLDFKK